MLGKSRRKKLLIDPKFQNSIIFHFFALMGVVLIATFFVASYLYSPLAQEIYNLGLPTDNSLMMAFGRFRYLLVVSSVAITIFALCMFYVAGLILSHRIAGPIYHLRKHLGEMAEGGEINHLRLRKRDYFLDVADNLNRFLDRIDQNKKD